MFERAWAFTWRANSLDGRSLALERSGKSCSMDDGLLAFRSLVGSHGGPSLEIYSLGARLLALKGYGWGLELGILPCWKMGC